MPNHSPSSETYGYRADGGQEYCLLGYMDTVHFSQPPVGMLLMINTLLTPSKL